MAGEQKSSKKQGKIRVTRNGPYVVTGGLPLSEQAIAVDKEGQCHGYHAGKKYPAQETYSLCRCGGSANKPYCDGTHAKIGFKS